MNTIKKGFIELYGTEGAIILLRAYIGFGNETERPMIVQYWRREGQQSTGAIRYENQFIERLVVNGYIEQPISRVLLTEKGKTMAKSLISVMSELSTPTEKYTYLVKKLDK